MRLSASPIRRSAVLLGIVAEAVGRRERRAARLLMAARAVVSVWLAGSRQARLRD